VRVRRAAVAPVLVVCALLAGACTTSYKKSTTKADFIAQADDICRTYDNRASKATQNLKHPGVGRRIAMVQDRLLPLLERRNTELARLTPPAADKATIARFLADLNAETNEVGLDPAGFVAAHDTSPLAQKAVAEAAAYGFEVCGRT
jgi:hypothetical protein